MTCLSSFLIACAPPSNNKNKWEGCHTGCLYSESSYLQYLQFLQVLLCLSLGLCVLRFLCMDHPPPISPGKPPENLPLQSTCSPQGPASRLRSRSAQPSLPVSWLGTWRLRCLALPVCTSLRCDSLRGGAMTYPPWKRRSLAWRLADIWVSRHVS